MLSVRAELKIGCERISNLEAMERDLPCYKAPAHEYPKNVSLVDLTYGSGSVFPLKICIKSPSPKQMQKPFVTPRSKRILQENQTEGVFKSYRPATTTNKIRPKTHRVLFCRENTEECVSKQLTNDMQEKLRLNTPRKPALPTSARGTKKMFNDEPKQLLSCRKGKKFALNNQNMDELADESLAISRPSSKL